ncbi:MAG: hypothetical protein DDG59_01710 [Anaerolineae bacterium]|jgi:hypothetical protein|nr:MAG: hypothetical protein DDG59_01710 [Anaerolineae bacterium]
MNSLRRGFAFLKQSWQMALKDPDLIKPSLYALIAGVVVTLIFSVPMAISFALFGDQGIGRILGYLFGALLIFAQYTVSYLFSAMTIYLIYSYLAEGDGILAKAWQMAQRNWLNILSLAAASMVVSLLQRFLKGKGDSAARNALASLIDAVWTQATYLVLPAMVIDNLNLKSGLQRATQIVRENLLLIGISMVGVRAVTGMLGFLIGGTGIAFGLGVGIGLVSLSGQAVWGVIAGLSVGTLIAGVFILVAVVIGSYTTTAYHTCLYLWARDVERARQEGQAVLTVQPPLPLAAVLS